MASGAGLEIPSQQALAHVNSKGRQGLWAQKDIHIVPGTPAGRHCTLQNLIEVLVSIRATTFKLLIQPRVRRLLSLTLIAPKF